MKAKRAERQKQIKCTVDNFPPATWYDVKKILIRNTTFQAQTDLARLFIIIRIMRTVKIQRRKRTVISLKLISKITPTLLILQNYINK